MKKLIGYLLIIVLILGLVGCSNNEQISFSSVNLKQEYVKEFTPSFTGEAVDITKQLASLYNQAIANKIPERETFESKFEDFNKISTSNNNEIDFKSYVSSFANNYKTLSANEFILNNAQNLYNDGILSKNDYNNDIKEAKITKDEILQKIKIDIENIMKYYE